MLATNTNSITHWPQPVQDVIEALTLSPATLSHIQHHFIQAMVKGLALPGQTLAMVPSFVTGTLTGTETGSYLALDLGGTYLRVSWIELKGQGGQVSTLSEKYRIEERLQLGHARHLFVKEKAIHVPDGQTLDLGFTFSFPVLQTAIDHGTLITWTKGYSAPGLVGQDPAVFLQQALVRVGGVPVRVAAMLNDTVGTLLAHAYRYPETAIGLGLGTGCNGAYVESIDKIGKWTLPSPHAMSPRHDTRMTPGSDKVIINMEFGAFDREKQVLPRTTYDELVDQQSLNPGEQLFEKRMAGMYLGEITRLVLMDLVQKRALFVSISTDNVASGPCPRLLSRLRKPWSLETKLLSMIQADEDPDLLGTLAVLDLYVAEDQADDGVAKDELRPSAVRTTRMDRQIVKKVVQLVGKRAAQLSACALTGILVHLGVVPGSGAGASDPVEETKKKKKVAIGVDGSLYRLYPGFAEEIKTGVRDLLGSSPVWGEGEDVREVEVEMGMAWEGSSVGAGLCAHLARRDPVL